MPTDDDFASFRDNLPRMWWNLYQGCLQQGFDKCQSFALLQTFILGSGKINPPQAEGPESDNPE